jgi:hypothetical protein
MRFTALALLGATVAGVSCMAPPSSSEGAAAKATGDAPGPPATESSEAGSEEAGFAAHSEPPVSLPPATSGSTDCGGSPCNGTCVSGDRCLVTLATTDQYAPSGLAVNTTDVYWGACTYGIAKIPLDGGALVTLAVGSAYDVALDATNVYWTAATPTSPYVSAVLSMPLAGGTITTLSSEQHNDGFGQLVALPLPLTPGANASQLYWNNPGMGVESVPVTGGTTSTITTSPPPSNYGIAVDATRVYWTDMGDGSPGAGSIHAALLDGSATFTIATGQYSPMDIAVDAKNVYWTSYGASAVVSVPLAGGTPTTIATGQANPRGIATDGSSVYWVNWGWETPTPTCTGSIVRADAPGAGIALGGAPTTLASGLGAGDRIAVDATSVYFTTDWLDLPTPCSSASVMKLTPK